MHDSGGSQRDNNSWPVWSTSIFVTDKRLAAGFFRSACFFCCALLLLMSALSVTVFAQEKSVNPGINRHYHGAAHEDWVPVFETESREIYAKRYEILRALNIEPGTRVADIGAGTGFFSLLFAGQTGPSGVVYAVDITDDFIRAIEARAAGAGIDNLVGVVNDGRVSGLAPQSIDLAFICDTYHHFEYPRDTMQSVYRALSDTGEVVIIDFRKDPRISSAWVQNHVRAGRSSVIQEMQGYGYELVADLPLLRTNYFLRFRKQQD